MRGHVRRRGSGWEIRVYVGRDSATNAKRYRTKTVRGSKEEAEQQLARLLLDTAGAAPDAHDATVADAVKQWFEISRDELSPTTVRTYQRYIDKIILPGIGNVRLSRLGPADLDHFYVLLKKSGGMHGAPLKPASVRQAHAIIRRALQQALRWGWITSNPAALARPPRVERHELAPPEPADVLALIARADQEDLQLGCLLRVAATTGARRGELCGLRWKSVDLENRTAVISRSVVEGMGGRIFEKDTKTHSARRISLDPVTVDALLAHRRRTEQSAAACGVDVPADAFVFSTAPDSSKPLCPSNVTKAFTTLRDRCGFPNVRLHDLRHFAASRLLAAGVPVRTVSGRLGHANAATTFGVYAHFLEESDRDAANTIGAILK